MDGTGGGGGGRPRGTNPPPLICITGRDSVDLADVVYPQAFGVCHVPVGLLLGRSGHCSCQLLWYPRVPELLADRLQPLCQAVAHRSPLICPSWLRMGAGPGGKRNLRCKLRNFL